MQTIVSVQGRRSLLATAVLLLALCLLAGGTQAMNDSMNTPALVAKPSLMAEGSGGLSVATGYETPIVVRDASQVDPAIHGTRVVWQDWRNDAWHPGKIIAASEGDIYSYNLTSHVEQPEGASVSQYGKYVPDDFDPVISDAGIFWIWWGRSDADTNNEVQGRTLQGDAINVTVVGEPSTRYLNDLAIQGNRLVYVLNEHRLILYDTNTRYVDTIRETTDEIRTPAVYGDTVAWQQYDGYAWSLYWYRLTEGQVHTMPWSSPDPLSLAIEGSTLVWADHRNGTWDINACDLSDPYTTQHAVVAAPGDQINPAVSGDRVVWQDNRSGNWDIYMGSLSGDVVATVCTAAGDQINPTVDGERIVWQDNRSGNWDIFMFTISSSAPVPVPTPAPLIITSPGTYSIAADGYDGSTTPIEIRSSNVVLDGAGHTIDGTDQPGSSGIRITGPVANIVVKNIHLTNWETGISADAVTDSMIERSEISHNFRGVALNGTQDVEVRDSRIDANDVTGVAVKDSVNATVRANDISRTGDGFTVYSGSGSFEDAYTFAVTVAGSDGTRVSGNDLGGRFASLYLTDSRLTKVTGNQLTGRSAASSRSVPEKERSCMTTSSGVRGTPCTVISPIPCGIRYHRRGRTWWEDRRSVGISGRRSTGQVSPRLTLTRTEMDSATSRTRYPWGGTNQLPLAAWSGRRSASSPGAPACRHRRATTACVMISMATGAPTSRTSCCISTRWPGSKRTSR